jgi:hypothetical protein
MVDVDLGGIRGRIRRVIDREVQDMKSDMEIDGEDLYADVFCSLCFIAIGAYGLFATATTPSTTLMGTLGSLGVLIIEAMLVVYGSFWAIATWQVYQRSEPSHQFDERVDAFEGVQGGDDG